MRIDANSTPELLQKLLALAINAGASDLHFEPQAKHMVIRFRIDGVLYPMTQLSLPAAQAIVSHLKIKANMDIAERRLPQDGRFTLTHDACTYTCRVASLPVLYGEKCVLRLLAQHAQVPSLSVLGFTQHQQQDFMRYIQQPQGLILITGATGSGKTTTLYSALQAINHQTHNITTIEDPIEIELEHINQSNINPKIGFTFATALRAILRQDPDIIMVGEIRDLETATMALHAAQTGHLVFSTLHCNSAREAFTRLSMMGIATLDLIESLHVIMAQRLVRLLCLHCHGTQDHLCTYCHEGFKGRTGVFECLILDVQSKHELQSGKSWQNVLANTPFMPLREAGLCKVNAGLTTLTELQRCLGAQR